MTREELVNLAEEAGFEVIKEDNEFCNGRFNNTVWWDDRPLTDEIERFAAIVAAVEREKAMKQERNFCDRCGKRLGGDDHIHTCTPPIVKRAEEAFESAKKREWVGLTDEEPNT